MKMTMEEQKHAATPKKKQATLFVAVIWSPDRKSCPVRTLHLPSLKLSTRLMITTVSSSPSIKTELNPPPPLPPLPNAECLPRISWYEELALCMSILSLTLNLSHLISETEAVDRKLLLSSDRPTSLILSSLNQSPYLPSLNGIRCRSFWAITHNGRIREQ